MNQGRSTEERNNNWATYRWILRHLRPYRWQMAAIIGCGTMAAASELVTPLLIQRLIDEIIPARDRSAFWLILAVMAAFFAVSVSCGIARNSLQGRVSAGAARDLQYGALQHLRKLGFSYYEQNPVGETLSLLNQQVRSAEQVLRRYFPDICQLSLFLLLSAGVLLYQSVWLSLIIVPCFLIYYLFGPAIDRKVTHVNKAMGDARVDFDKKTYESVSGVREIRAYGTEEWDIGRSRGKFKRVTDTVLTWVYYIHLRWSLRNLLFQAGTVAIFVTGYFFIKWSWMSVGQFVAFLLVYSFFMFRLSWLVSQFIDQGMALRQVARLHRMVLTPPTLTESANPVEHERVEGALTFENVHFAYAGRPPVLQGVSVGIRTGERVAVVGKSGNGKSTLLKLIDRFYDPSEGEIRLDDVPLPKLALSVLRNALGYVFQDTYLFGSTIRENIRFGHPDATDEQIVDAAKAAFAHDFIAELADGYDTVVGERGMKLSGGQKQRIAIARMFIKNPRIVLLDEATSALDNISENAVRDALRRLLAGRTTIAVAHRLSTVMDYDRILVLDGGVVAEQGSYEELLAKRGLFYQLAEGERRGSGSGLLETPALTMGGE